MRFIAAVLAALVSSIGAAQFAQEDILHGGQGGYFAYRTPNLAVTGKGTLVAVLCGRKGTVSDFAEIDALSIRSFDGGKTWSKPQVIADGGEDGMSNTCTLVDRTTNTIWVFMSRISSTARQSEKGGKKAIIDGESVMTPWFVTSTDDGATWSAPAALAARLEPADPSITYHANGPGIGVQLTSGRLIVPRYYRRRGSDVSYSHVIYSDDHGRNWRQGKAAGPYTNEHQVAELADGVLMMNARSYHGKNRRAVSISRDGGETWSEPKQDDALIEPVCQGSFVRLDPPASSRVRLLFLNPASVKRENMTVRLSNDSGATWPVAKTLHTGPAAYSSLVVLKDGNIACLYERGEKGPYERLTFARFSLKWLTE